MRCWFSLRTGRMNFPELASQKSSHGIFPYGLGEKNPRRWPESSKSRTWIVIGVIVSWILTSIESFPTFPNLYPVYGTLYVM